MTVVKISATADQELLDMLGWIARESPQNALEFIGRLQTEARDVLATFPKAGRTLGDGTRYSIISGRVVVYDYHADIDEVVVLHCYGPGQDW